MNHCIAVMLSFLSFWREIGGICVEVGRHEFGGWGGQAAANGFSVKVAYQSFIHGEETGLKSRTGKRARAFDAVSMFAPVISEVGDDALHTCGGR